MAIDFPNSPTTGDTYTAGGRTWQWDGTVWAAYGNYPDPTVLKIDTGTNRVGINNTSPTTALDVTGDLTVSGNISGGSITGAGMTVSSTAPSSPSEGEMWYNEVSGRTFVYYDDGSSQQWVEFGVPPNGSKIALASYADSAARTTALPSPSEADLSYLQDTNSVEVYDGSSWVRISGVATAFTPTWQVGFTVGNATEEWYYIRIGDFVHVYGNTLLGSTSAVTGSLEMAYPVAREALAVQFQILGTATLFESGVGYKLGAVYGLAAGLRLNPLISSGTYVAESNTSATVPFTWAAGDAFGATFTYKAD